jgi:hypothetical protein
MTGAHQSRITANANGRRRTLTGLVNDLVSKNQISGAPPR